MARSADICAVCRRPRTRGSHNLAGDVFICTDCETDAQQFIEIQDRTWAEADEDAKSTNETDDGARP